MTIPDRLGLGLARPIIQAPMAGVQDQALAIAVSDAGGLGSLPAAMLAPDALASALADLAEDPARRFNVNFFCHRSPRPDPDRDAEWRRLLAGYYARFDLDPAATPTGAARRPFDSTMADVLAAAPRPPTVVSFHFGLPEPALLERVRALGAKILSSATTVDEAVWLEAHGVDAIIAQGLEAGGHRGHFLRADLDGQLPTRELVVGCIAKVRVPVIAAGGIADADDVEAMLDLGAVAAQVGTAYMLCPEAKTSRLHREALAEFARTQPAGATAITNVFTGRPARGLVNRLIRDLGPISAAAPAFPLAANAVGPLRARAEAEGSADFTPLWSGVDPSGCRPVPAADLTRSLTPASAHEC